jgi:uncharacterized protein YbdZ (MbtH family)
MRRSTKAEFGIIMNEHQLCSVWPADEVPPPGWCFTGARGTKEQMQSRVDQQFVPTAPVPPVEMDRRYRDAEWALAEFDD